MHLSNNVTNRIEEWLHTATNRQAKRKYLILQMILRQGAFVANGLQVKGEQPIELFNRIIKMVPEADEIVELEEHVQITDPQTLSWLSQLKTNRCDNVHPAVDESPQTSPKFVGKNPCESFSDIRMGVQFGVYHRIDNTTIRDTYMNFSNEDDIDSSIAALQSEEKRAELIEAVAEYDDDMMMTYLDGGEVSIEMIKSAIRKGTLAVKFFPVMCGTALGNKGIKLLLDSPPLG